MKFWTLFFIVCLELLSNATRAIEPKESTSVATMTQAQIASDKDENKAVDRGLVKNIRQELLKDNSLSKSGKSIQIIVVGKEITLKGPIPSEEERTKILTIAGRNSAGHRIRNQLEVLHE